MYELGPQFKMDDASLQVDPSCIVIGPKFRIEILTERLIRIEYSETGKFVDSATALVINRKFPRPMFTIKEDQGYI